MNSVSGSNEWTLREGEGGYYLRDPGGEAYFTRENRAGTWDFWSQSSAGGIEHWTQDSQGNWKPLSSQASSSSSSPSSSSTYMTSDQVEKISQVFDKYRPQLPPSSSAGSQGSSEDDLDRPSFGDSDGAKLPLSDREVQQILNPSSKISENSLSTSASSNTSGSSPVASSAPAAASEILDWSTVHKVTHFALIAFAAISLTALLVSTPAVPIVALVFFLAYSITICALTVSMSNPSAPSLPTNSSNIQPKKPDDTKTESERENDLSPPSNVENKRANSENHLNSITGLAAELKRPDEEKSKTSSDGEESDSGKGFFSWLWNLLPSPPSLSSLSRWGTGNDGYEQVSTDELQKSKEGSPRVGIPDTGGLPKVSLDGSLLNSSSMQEIDGNEAARLGVDVSSGEVVDERPISRAFQCVADGMRALQSGVSYRAKHAKNYLNDGIRNTLIPAVSGAWKRIQGPTSVADEEVPLLGDHPEKHESIPDVDFGPIPGSSGNDSSDSDGGNEDKQYKDAARLLANPTPQSFDASEKKTKDCSESSEKKELPKTDVSDDESLEHDTLFGL